MEFNLIHPTRERQLKCILSIYMLFAGREVRIGKPCARSLEYGVRQQAAGSRQQAAGSRQQAAVLSNQFLC